MRDRTAQFTVIPAIWVRYFHGESKKDFHFHGYVIRNEDPNYYYDIFGRTLTEPTQESALLESAVQTGPKNSSDGYHVRVNFK